MSTPNPHPDLNLNSQQVDFQQPGYIHYQITFPLAIQSTSTSLTILIVRRCECIMSQVSTVTIINMQTAVQAIT